MIVAKDLTKSFPKNPAVSSLDFKIQKGEIFGIVGPDGAGKSTLLRLMSTILVPDKGELLINDVDIFKDSYLIKEKMAYMPQRFGLYEDLTVEENIYFFGRLFSVPGKEIKKRSKRLYDFSKLGPFKDRLAGKLSGGMKQKLGLACSLIHTPEIILLDEPTNGVDPVSRREFWKILYDLLGEGVTIVVSTAYLDEAERCNRIALMYKGKFIRLGEPKSIRKGINKKLLEINVTEPMECELILQGSGDFKTIIRSGSFIRIFTGDMNKTKTKVRRLLQKNKKEIISIKQVMPSLEDTFVEIISEEEL
ncbi:ABC transporter ATP-binding protein [Spirochaetota bacterium]